MYKGPGISSSMTIEICDDGGDFYLIKLQTRVLKNIFHMFPYRPARKA
jgi:hypothetical protein